MAVARSQSRWRRGAAAAFAVALVALALVGLRGAPASAGATAEASGSKSVNINHFAFHPGTLRVAKGAKVTFANSSGVTHTATRKGDFDTGRIKPGQSISVRFGQKGTFAYHCEIHPFMHGKIVVE